MAQLSSPGVSVTVIDESFYTPAAAGTVPLFIVASAENKQNGSATGTAPGTLKANAGKVYLLTSQKDLSDTFGVPKFYTDASNNPIHAGEQNEYGLEAAYSFLGVSNRAYVVRADLDLGGLTASATAPTSAPDDGTVWLDTADTKWGVFEWNASDATTVGGQQFSAEKVSVITDASLTTGGMNPAPQASYGSLGDYAIVATTTLLKLWFKKYRTNTAAGTWVEVGTDAWQASWPTVSGTAVNPTVAGNIVVNGYTVTGATTVDGVVTALGSHATGVTAANINGTLVFYSTGVDVAISGAGAADVGIAVGTYAAPALQISPHTQVPLFKSADQVSTYVNGYPTGSIWVKTTNANLGADYIVQQYNSAASAFKALSVGVYENGQSALATLDPKGGGLNLAIGTVYVKFNDDEASPKLSNFKLYRRTGVGATSITSNPITSSSFTASTSYTFTVQESTKGSSSLSSASTITFTGAAAGAGKAAADANALLAALTAAGLTNVKATLDTTSNTITITHATGGEIRFVDTLNDPLAQIFSTTTTANFYLSPTGTSKHYVATLWSSLATGTNNGFATISASAPKNIPANGTLWYDSALSDVDIMINDGSKWVGYLNYTQNQAGGTTTDPAGPIVSATQPTTQSDGTALANGDLWIDTSNVENFPIINKYNYLTKTWVLIDNTDQTSENGVVFHDARWSTSGVDSDMPASIADLLESNFVDPDVADPLLYPKGMLLWNLRRSSYNVKKYVKGYIDTTKRNTYVGGGLGEVMTSYYPNRWVSIAPNDYKGAGQFGHKAQRAVVLQALAALANENQQIRDEESRIFNLLACPGYPEMIQPLVNLNYDRGLTAFIVGDTPARLTPDATTISNWGNNVAGAADNGDEGLVTTDPYLGVFYPWGYTTDLLGNNIVVPPSHMMLRTIALSDNVSYPWFAPAGTRRGGITNASSVGYINAQTGEFNTTALNTGQRDTLASVHINPLTYLTGTGLVAYGQKTRQLTASSLDRINVARLVIYLRRQLSQLAKPYIFEPNDTITRNEIKQAAEQLLLELVGQRAIYDFLVVCDTSNNTPARIDRSELYLDIAIEPVKAVEFIYIPLRLKNTGEIKGLGK